MAVNAPFYVMNEKDELVPANFWLGQMGNISLTRMDL